MQTTNNVMKFFLFLFLFPVLLFAGISVDMTKPVPGFKLQLEQETFLTDKYGVNIPAQIIQVPIGKSVVIYRTDGTCYKGIITEIEEGEGFYKIYGKMNDLDETSFGFVMARGGNFAGALIEKKTNKTYVIEFSPEHKGFVFVRSTKYDKPSA